MATCWAVGWCLGRRYILGWFGQALLSKFHFFPLCRGDHKYTQYTPQWLLRGFIRRLTSSLAYRWRCEIHIGPSPSSFTWVTMHSGDVCAHTHICTQVPPAYLLSIVKMPKVKQSQQELWAQKACLLPETIPIPQVMKNMFIWLYIPARDPHSIIQTSGQASQGCQTHQWALSEHRGLHLLLVPGCPRSGLTSKSHLLHWAARTAGSKVNCLLLRSQNRILLHYSLAVG